MYNTNNITFREVSSSLHLELKIRFWIIGCGDATGSCGEVLDIPFGRLVQTCVEIN